MKTPWSSTIYPHEILVGGVLIENPSKVMFPESGVRKGDVAQYYLAVAERMLPSLKNRLISSVRCPGGIDGSCFFRKHPASASKGVGILCVTEASDKTQEYYYIQDASGLISEVRMDTVEFHPWGSSVEALEQPNMMVFDLDPDAGMDLDRVRQGVRDLKSILDEFSLKTFLKTSGGKGYHIVFPIKPTVSWDDFHVFAKNTARLMESRWPDCYTSNSRKNQRGGRIFIDWLRNSRGATSVSPYSLRARNSVAVSMPISWDELDEIAPNQITMENALGRLLLPDPWEKYWETDQELLLERF